MTDERLPDLGPGRAYYEGRKGLFFLSEVDRSAKRWSGSCDTKASCKQWAWCRQNDR